MLLTEEQAKQKWCPWARIARDGSGIGNRYSFDNDLATDSAFARCIASDCMAWRWTDCSSKAVAGRKVEGYCGLAGKPA